MVDDGSKDNTVDVVMGYVDRHGSDTIRVLKLQENRGKGGAIRLAVFRSRGQYILMADSDGATDIRDLQKLHTRLKAVEKPSVSGSLGVGVGSRAHMQDEAVATVNPHVINEYHIYMNMNMTHVYLLCGFIRGRGTARCSCTACMCSCTFYAVARFGTHNAVGGILRRLCYVLTSRVQGLNCSRGKLRDNCSQRCISSGGRLILS